MYSVSDVENVCSLILHAHNFHLNVTLNGKAIRVPVFQDGIICQTMHPYKQSQLLVVGR